MVGWVEHKDKLIIRGSGDWCSSKSSHTWYPEYVSHNIYAETHPSILLVESLIFQG